MSPFLPVYKKGMQSECYNAKRCGSVRKLYSSRASSVGELYLSKDFYENLRKKMTKIHFFDRFYSLDFRVLGGTFASIIVKR